MKISLFLLALVVTCGLPRVCLGDDKPIPFNDILARALQESPLVKQIEFTAAAGRAEGIKVGTVENPVLDAEVRIPSSYRGDRGSDEVAVAVSQPLRLSNFGVRQRVNDLLQSAAAQQQRVELLEFTQNLRLAAVKVWALERRMRNLDGLRKQIGEIEKIVQQGTSTGLFGAGETSLFHAEALKLAYQKKAAQADIARARSELSRRAGFSVQGQLQMIAIGEPPTRDSLLDADSIIPARERAQLASRVAAEQARLARLDATPKFAPRFVYERTNDATDFFGVGISLDLPLFDRNQAERMKYTAATVAADSMLKYFSGESFAAEVEAHRAALIAAAALQRGYEQEILPALKEAVAAQERNVRAGQGSVFQMWQIVREFVSTEIEAIEHTVRAHTERAEFVILTGQEF